MAVRIPVREEKRDSQKGKVTCLTCKLKGCVGHCHFQMVVVPRTRKIS
jgi:hypothetical protein